VSFPRNQRGRKAPYAQLFTMIAGLGLLSACAVAPEPLTEAENGARSADIHALFAQQEKVAAPITLHEALARAIRYNLTSRVKEVEQQMAENRSGASFWTFLPHVVADASKTTRNNVLASSSQSIDTGNLLLSQNTSQDRIHDEESLKVTWNVLDFGVSYFTSRQVANQSLIAQERRRKVLQQMVYDVRDAYWRAVSAERLLTRIDAALDQVRTATEKAEAIEASRAQKPVEILNYQRDLYGKLLQLQGIRRNLLSAKMDLAKLMNLPPATEFTIAIPADQEVPPQVLADMRTLEDQALANRPELHEESLQKRVAADEVRKSIARMFPGIEFNASVDRTSNSFNLHHRWAEAGLKLSWNLVNLLSGWDDIDHAKLQERLAEVRGETMGMAVLTQVNLSFLDYREAEDAYQTASKILTVNERIEQHRQREAAAQNLGDLELIQNQLNSLLSQMKKDEQYAQLQNALGRLVMSVGAETMGNIDERLDVSALAAKLKANEKEWMGGAWFQKSPTPTAAAPVPAAEPAS
jgi:outer membrane protein, multidrug efflux system